MKKVIIFLVAMLPFIGVAQTTNVNTPKSIVNSRGVIGADSGFVTSGILPSNALTNTIASNGGSLFVRNGNTWNAMGSGTSAAVQGNQLIQVLSLGNSLTAGVNVPVDSNGPAFTSRRLNALSTKFNSLPYNLGYPGHSTLDFSRQFDFHNITETLIDTQTHIILLDLGTNDIKNRYYDSVAGTVTTSTYSYQNFIIQYKALYRRIQQTSGNAVVIPVIPGAIGLDSAHFRAFRNFIKDSSKTVLGAPTYINLYDDSTVGGRLVGQPPIYFMNDLHYRVPGYSIIGRIVADTILSFVSRNNLNQMPKPLELYENGYDDDLNTWGVGLPADISVSDLELSTDGGYTITVPLKNPMPLGNVSIPVGSLWVRVRAKNGNQASPWLKSKTAFTSDTKGTATFYPFTSGTTSKTGWLVLPSYLIGFGGATLSFTFHDGFKLQEKYYGISQKSLALKIDGVTIDTLKPAPYDTTYYETHLNDGVMHTAQLTVVAGGQAYYTGFTDYNKNILPAGNTPFNPIAGTNITLSGTYPNITFNAAGGSGGSFNPASPGPIGGTTPSTGSFTNVLVNRLTVAGGVIGYNSDYPTYTMVSVNGNYTNGGYAGMQGGGDANLYFKSQGYTDWTSIGSTLMRLTNVGRLGLGTAFPDASSIIDISSTAAGFLPPRMTKTQRNAISSPAAGLIIYQTDNTPGLRCYNGTNWVKYTETND